MTTKYDQVNLGLGGMRLSPASVTQLTSKTTAVVSNTTSVIITTVALTDATLTGFAFNWNNTRLTSASCVRATVCGYSGTSGAAAIPIAVAGSPVSAVGSTTAYVPISVFNGGSGALSGTVKILVEIIA